MKDERIDDYVTGKMSEADRLSFERELADNQELHSEVLLHQDIVRAIRMKAAKEHLQQVEQDIRTRTRRRNVFAIRISSIAVAACLAIGIFVHFDYMTNYQAVGNALVLESDAERGGAQTTDVILYAVDNGKYDEALNLIADAETLEFKSEFTHPDLIEQDRLEYNRTMETLQWYKAVVYMRMGKWIKARRLLKQIAESDSRYKKVARQTLDRL